MLGRGPHTISAMIDNMFIIYTDRKANITFAFSHPKTLKYFEGEILASLLSGTKKNLTNDEHFLQN